jgi:hypothetical protein
MINRIPVQWKILFGPIAGLVWILLSLTSCEKTGVAEFSNLPVVEAYLSPGEKIKVVISRKIPYDSEASTVETDISNLEVFIGCSGASFHLIPQGDGIYVDTAGAVQVMIDSVYTLTFIYNGSTVSSTTVVPTKPSSVQQSVTYIKMSQIDPENPSGTNHTAPVEITFANSDNSYYLTTVECIETTLVPVYKDSIPANDMFSSIPVTGTQINIEPMRIRYFGMNRIILYHINAEYSKFFMHQASTSQNYEEPPTNIANGLGIFTGINSDTLFLNVIQVK